MDKLEDFDITEERRLIEFSPEEKSEDIPENMGSQIAYFSDTGTVQVTKEIGEFKSYRFVNNTVIRNRDEAETLRQRRNTHETGSSGPKHVSGVTLTSTQVCVWMCSLPTGPTTERSSMVVG